MTLSELSISDLSALMAYFSRKMSKMQDRTPENTNAWEVLAFSKSCVINEMEKRIGEIQFLGATLMSKAEEQEWDALNDNTDWMSDEQIREAGTRIREKYARLKQLKTLTP